MDVTMSASYRTVCFYVLQMPLSKQYRKLINTNT